MEVAGTLGHELVAIVLGGGYGRGEGCVLIQRGCERPYNDVDLFLITTSKRTAVQARLSSIAANYEELLGIAVDFSRPQTVQMVRNWPCTLMWQELLLGHRVLFGPEDILISNVAERVRGPLPLIEASRLLLNRGAGLVWAQRVLENLETSPDLTFVPRNYYKCMLGIADALLIAHGSYTSESDRKRENLREVAAREPFASQIAASELMEGGLAFRRSVHEHLAVSTSDCRILAGLWIKTFLWIESARLERRFSCPEDYAAWTGHRETLESGRLWRLAANVKQGRLTWKHPREYVYEALPAALLAMKRGSCDFIHKSSEALRYWRCAV